MSSLCVQRVRKNGSNETTSINHFREIKMATTHNDTNNNQNTGSRNNQSGSGNQGFASMDPERQKEIASQGGKAAHAAGTAHEFTSEEAREAGSHSHDNGGSRSSNGSSSNTRGGSTEQHVPGRQGHKNEGNR
jgi:hypothetical protein